MTTPVAPASRARTMCCSLDLLPRELSEMILKACPPAEYHALRSTCRQLFYASLAPSVLDAQLSQSGLVDRSTVAAGKNRLESAANWNNAFVIAASLNDSYACRDRAASRSPFLLSGRMRNLLTRTARFTISLAHTLGQPFKIRPVKRLDGLLARTQSRSIHAFDLSYESHFDSLARHSFSNCGLFLLSGTDGFVTVTSLKGGVPRPVVCIPIHGRAIHMAMDTSAGNYQMAVCTRDNSIFRYNLDKVVMPGTPNPIGTGRTNEDRQREPITSISFAVGTSFKTYIPGENEDITFGPVQIWIRELDLSDTDLPTPVPADFASDLNMTKVETAQQFAVGSFNSPICSLAICPRTGAVGFGTNTGTGVYWRDGPTNQYQTLTSNSLQQADHIAFVDSQPHLRFIPRDGHEEIQEEAGRMTLVASRAANPTDFSLAMAAVSESRDDAMAMIRRDNHCISYVRRPPTPTFEIDSFVDLQSNIGLNGASTIEWAQVREESVVYPLSDGIHGVYAPTTGAAHLLVANCIRSFARRPVLCLFPPREITAGPGLVAVGRQDGCKDTIVAVHGRDMVLYSIPPDWMNDSREVPPTPNNPNFPVAEDVFANAVELVDDEDRIETAATVTSDETEFDSDAETAVGVESQAEPTKACPPVVKGVYVGSVDSKCASIALTCEEGRLIVWAVSNGRLQSWSHDFSKLRLVKPVLYDLADPSELELEADRKFDDAIRPSATANAALDLHGYRC